jgi:hypothetical protein
MRKGLLRALRPALPPILVAGALGLAGLLVIRELVPLHALVESNDEVGNFIQVLGTIYAVLLAFAVYVVWGQYNEARVVLEQEANEIIDFHRAAMGLSGETRDRVSAALRAYVEMALGPEWQAMARIDEAGFEPGWKVLEDLWAGIHDYEPTTECQRTLYSESLVRFNDLSDARTRRLSASRTRLPPGLRLILYLGATMTVMSLYLLAVEHVVTHGIIVVVLAGAIAHVIAVVEDLDDPFAGEWQVSVSPLERAQRIISAPRSVEPSQANG